jgi:hypothetical protein
MAGSLDKYREWGHLLNQTGVSEDVRRLPAKVAGDGDAPWNLAPDYQRGHVWTTRQAELFVGNFIEGGLVQPIYVQRYESPDNAPAGSEYWTLPCEVIDGQQRIRALLAWLAGDIEAEVSCGDRIRYVDLDVIDRRGLPFVRVTYVDLSRRDRLRFYLRLNRGGTVHTDEEIERVRSLLAAETPAP